MATIKKKSNFAIKGAVTPGGELGYETAARRYVNKGISELGLKPIEKDKLRNKLIPIVAKKMKVERGRAYDRSKKNM